ncbi:MAG: TetR/AcrR family transcriptional regulator [Candidatus Sulfotelmatobacter sp.]
MATPVSDCDLRDPRQKRTRRLLQDALRKLLREKPFEEILVQDIAEVATVNRATFYDHYTDKFTLFEAMVAGDFHELLKQRNIRFDGTCPSAIEAIVRAVCDYLKEIHRNEKQCASRESFGPLLDSAVTRALRLVVLDGLAKSTRTTVSHQVLASTISWAIYGATREWFYTTKRQSNDEIVSFVATVVVPILEAGVDRGAFSQLGTSKGEKTEPSRNRHREN